MRFNSLVLIIATLAVTCALLAGMVVALYQGYETDLRLNAAITHIDRNTDRIQANGKRSCAAIHGASQFWKVVRKGTIMEIQDPRSTPATISADQVFLDALNNVIKLADALPCGDK